MTNQMSSVVKSNENRTLYVALIVLALVAGLVVGWQLGESSSSRATKEYIEQEKLKAVMNYSQAAYIACKRQEEAVGVISSQQKRRNCEYLKNIM